MSKIKMYNPLLDLFPVDQASSDNGPLSERVYPAIAAASRDKPARYVAMKRQADMLVVEA